MTSREPKARPGEEIWETTTDGVVWVNLTDERGRERQTSVGGKAGSRLRIMTVDREICQDRAVYGDPFTNGMLRRIDDVTANVPDALSTDQLLLGFSKSGRAFHSFVAGLNEMNTRRMRSMADSVDATVAQISHLDEVIKMKYRQEGDTPSYRAYMDRPAS